MTVDDRGSSTPSDFQPNSHKGVEACPVIILVFLMPAEVRRSFMIG
jgi:hypothetical protein